MGKATLSLLIISILICDPVCLGQTIEVSDPRLELRDNNIHITYDILNSDPSDEFTVSMQITDATGQVVPANALTGDIGDMVKGGSNKHIVWDLTADKIVMNSKIYVKILAKAVAPPLKEQETLPVVKDPVEEIQEESPALNRPEKEEVTQGVVSKSFSRSSLILQSLPIPGLGLSRLTGNPHWIRGVVAYGCITGSIVLNRMAVDTYSQIPGELEWDDKNKLFQQSQKQDGFSELLAYAAIGIWVSDLIWTIVGTSDLKKSPVYSETNGFSFRTTIDPLSSAPLIGIRYLF